MKREVAVLHFLPLILLAGACVDRPVLAPDDVPVAFAKQSALQLSGGCLSAPDFIVGDEGALLAALAVAPPGTSVALEGMIDLQSQVTIFIPGLTLGCATPGAGLRLAAGASSPELLEVAAPDVTVRGLVLDGTMTTEATLAAWPLDMRLGPTARLSLLENEVICGAAICVWLVGTPQPLVVGNTLHGMSTGGGLQIQPITDYAPDGSLVTYRPDGARVEGNEIIQVGEAPPSPVLAGIRVYSSHGAVVTGNTIKGAWLRGIAPTDVTGGLFAGNRIEGVLEQGIVTSINNPPGAFFTDNVIRENRILGAGAGGILLQMGCGNTVASNAVSGAGVDVTLAPSTGNTTVKHAGTVVDQGYMDCDGDRLADFNAVNGRTTLETHREEIPAKAATACLASPDHVVHDEVELRAALGAAAPWDEIALDGMIGVTSLLTVETPGLTLGCATQGSGLTQGAPFEGDPWGILWARAPDVTLRGLRIDGTPTTQVPVHAADDGGLALANVRFRFVGNDVTYGAQGGLFTAAAKGVEVMDNRFHGESAQYAIHVQGQGFGSRVERNEASVETGQFLMNRVAAGIRFRDGGGGRVADNVIRGPWVRGINLAELWDSDIVGNVVEGALTQGIRTGVNWYQPVSVHHNRIQNNRISGAGLSAMFLQQACSNVLLGNHLSGNGDGVGIVFDVTTGLNVLTGNTVTALDNGAFDCDGDGAPDPNIITGKGRVGKGIPPGEIIGPVISGGRRTPG